MAVTGFEITRQTEFADGSQFGKFGSYMQMDGRVHLEVNPGDHANRRIVDLSLAADSPGTPVRFSADFSLVTPANHARGAGKLLIDVPNRGNRLTSPVLQRVVPVNPEDRVNPGDGFLCRRGFSYLAVGWQWDAEGDEALRLYPPLATMDGKPIRGQVLMKLQPVADRDSLALAQLGQTAPPYPVVDPESALHRLFVKPHENAERIEISRDRWQFAHVKSGEVVRSDRHILLEGGFARGQIYELVYTTEGAPVVGAGLLSVRDVAACVGHGDTASPVPRAFNHTYAFGVSQTGRFLREFLHDGMNVDERGRKVFDGVWIHIAGAQRGDFNHRFAQPTVATVPSLGQRFPFSTASGRDPFTQRSASLLDNLEKSHRPRVIISNTSWEYWRGDASLAHIMGDEDLPEDEDTRIYHIAGTHHIGGIMANGKQLTEVAATGLKVAMPLNVVNYAPVSRALLVLLDEWAAQGIAPPPSRHPRLDDGTAVSRRTVLEQFSGLPGVAMLDADKLQSIRFQPEQPENARGIVSPPVPEAEPYPCYVSALDPNLNETAGIRLPDVAWPLGIHTGWNARASDTGAGDQAAIFAGFTRFFPVDEINARYIDEAYYLDAVVRHTDKLIEARFILSQDRDWVIQLARDRYRAATAKS